MELNPESAVDCIPHMHCTTFALVVYRFGVVYDVMYMYVYMHATF